MTSTRAVSQVSLFECVYECRADAPSGATAYASASVTEFSGVIPDAVSVAAVHWQLCGEHEMTLFSYPAEVPEDARRPEVAALGV